MIFILKSIVLFQTCNKLHAGFGKFRKTTRVMNAVCNAPITMKNFSTFLGGWDPFSINNFALSTNNEPFYQGEVVLKFPDSQIQNLLTTLE